MEISQQLSVLHNPQMEEIKEMLPKVSCKAASPNQNAAAGLWTKPFPSKEVGGDQRILSDVFHTEERLYVAPLPK